ncbi:MAG: hypothetical protein ACK47B_20445 [Armatimonadota bacterium]
MPPVYIVCHLLLAGLCAVAALRLPPHSAARRLAGTVLVLLTTAGLFAERSAHWTAGVMALRWPDAVFFTNLSLPLSAVLVALLAQAARDRGSRVRAAVLGVGLVGVSLWSYTWYFAPLPDGLHGEVDGRGFCPQTSSDSCSAAAATMLLDRHGVPSNEAEMAQLCLTRSGRGTTPLGMFRGLTIAGGEAALRPRLVRFDPETRLRQLRQPALVGVGLARNAPADLVARMEQYGWAPGLRHTILVERTDPAGEWIEVSDPTNGPERWPTRDLEHLWDGYALILEPN